MRHLVLILVDDDPVFRQALCEELQRALTDDNVQVFNEDDIQDQLAFSWVRRPLNNDDVYNRLVLDWAGRDLGDDDVPNLVRHRVRRDLGDNDAQDRLVFDPPRRALDHHGKTRDYAAKTRAKTRGGKTRSEPRVARSDDPKEPRREAQPERAAFVSKQEAPRDELPPPPPLDDLRHFLQTHCPVLYAQVLEPTLADLREEYASALAEGQSVKARRVLLQGCGALVAAAICQLGFSLLGRIKALWKARSPK